MKNAPRQPGSHNKKIIDSFNDCIGAPIYQNGKKQVPLTTTLIHFRELDIDFTGILNNFNNYVSN